MYLGKRISASRFRKASSSGETVSSAFVSGTRRGDSGSSKARGGVRVRVLGGRVGVEGEELLRRDRRLDVVRGGVSGGVSGVSGAVSGVLAADPEVDEASCSSVWDTFRLRELGLRPLRLFGGVSGGVSGRTLSGEEEEEEAGDEASRSFSCQRPAAVMEMMHLPGVLEST